jgi:uncharacterized membrane protein
MNERSVYRLQLILLASYFTVAAALWPLLPRRMPLHLSFTGEATAWTTTTLLSWFGLPLFSVAMAAFIFSLGRLAVRTPELWNIPEKQRFLALPPAERAPIEAYLRGFLAWCSVLVTISFIGIHIGLYDAATEHVLGLSWLSNLVAFAPIGVILLLAVRSSRTAAKLVRARHEGR